jgi:phosphoglycolate phosphatase
MVAAIHGCAASCRMGVVTGNVTAAVQEFLVVHGIAAWFPVVLGADTPGSRVEKILRAVQMLGGTARDKVWVVGDSVSDIRAAREAGVSSIAVGWGHQSLKKLASLNPDHIVHKPEELACLLASLPETEGG